MNRVSRRKAILRRRIFLGACAVLLAVIITGICLIVSAVKKNTGNNSSGNASSVTSSQAKDKDKTSSKKDTGDVQSTASSESSDITDNNDSSNTAQSTDTPSSDNTQSTVSSEAAQPPSVVYSPNKKPKNAKLVSSAYVVNMGDIMVHSTQLDGAKTADGGYDFSAFFKNIKGNVSKADLAVANLEVTFGGTESGAFSGYPAFNTPDSLADVIKGAGFDLMLTTNNHTYDTGLFGLKRTLDVLKSKGLSYIGTKQSAGEKSYTVKNVNGIKLGITAFTYENISSDPSRKSLNGNILLPEANDLVNSFNYDRIDSFYSEAQTIIANMRKEGAKQIIFYMHWGEEYHLAQNVWQSSIAQKLCNLGVDIIVGSHPHVIEPIQLLHAEGGEHKAVCIYSMGNGISNQRQEIMNPECPTGHTEDGMLFSYRFDKYSDGTVILSSVDILPTWVDKYPGGSGYQYTVYPLENRDSGAGMGLTGTALTKSQNSYDRTKAIVGAGLTEVQNYLGCKKRFG